GALVSEYLYNHDALGRVVSRNADAFGYNSCSELISAAMGTNHYIYGYDGIGNAQWTDINGDLTLYHTNPLNQYTNILGGLMSSCEPQYDLDGNMTATGDGWHYVWNGENRMILASNNAVRVEYAYDHRGRMVEKTICPASATAEKTISYLW